MLICIILIKLIIISLIKAIKYIVKYKGGIYDFIDFYLKG